MKGRVMRRVYAIWLAKEVFNSFTVRVAVLAVMLAEIRQYASIKHVLYNSPSFVESPSKAFGFFGNALAETELVVAVTVTAGLFVILWLCRDTARRITLGSHYSALLRARM